ncbi:MAG: hypothetical protein HQ462_07410 [Deltaproteobacteria bacterium]|nr:hypothetical protein [Deltaproteobacteria bacterium]
MTKNKSISRPLSLLSAPLVKSLLLFICSLFFTPSFLCADEGLAFNHVNFGHPRKEINKAEISGMADNGTHALIVGTRIIDLPTPVNPPALAPSRQVGWIKLITMATGLGDSAFNSAGNATKNIFEPEAPPDAGSIYVRLANPDKLNLCTSVVWDSTNSVFWVGCRSLNIIRSMWSIY